jgi:hypothetical protein
VFARDELGAVHGRMRPVLAVPERVSLRCQLI